MCVVSLREEVMKRDERASREGLSVVSVGVCVCAVVVGGHATTERASDTRTMTAAPFLC